MENAGVSEEWEQLHIDEEEEKEDEFVIIRGNNGFTENSIFPSTNQEDLALPDITNPSFPEPPPPQPQPPCPLPFGRWRACLGLLINSWMIQVAASKVRILAVCAAAAAGVAAAAVFFGSLKRWRRRRRRRVGRKDIEDHQWMVLNREKDEKIRQLLFQIAQMNEIMSARQRVPVLRVD